MYMDYVVINQIKASVIEYYDYLKRSSIKPFSFPLLLPTDMRGIVSNIPL